MHCKDDFITYFDNSEKLGDQHKVQNVPYHLKVVPVGGHGIGLANGSSAEGWVNDAVQFWQVNCWNLFLKGLIKPGAMNSDIFIRKS